MQSLQSKKLRLGIVGGGPGSWIGHIHRIASRIDNKFIICSGVFSRNPEKSRKFGQSIGLDKDRCYSNFKKMALKESKRKDGIEVVSIMTPPSSHQQIAEIFIKKNIHTISDKPFAATLDQAKKLIRSIKSNKKIVYALTHNYSAYPMVRQAKQLIKQGRLGKVKFVNVEYIQDWAKGENINKKNAKRILKWKLNKSIVGVSSVLNEIGSHAYHLALYITGLYGKRLFADIKQISKNIKVDDNAQVLIDYENGAKGMFWTCTSAKGGVYGLKIRVYGTKGSIEWVQNDPNYLRYNPAKGAVRFLERGFNEASFSKKFSRIKFGHPEGYLEAFANIYREIAKAINDLKLKRRKNNYFFPTAEEGYFTAKFVDTCKRSSSKGKWVRL